jgi:hypothetical protein
MKRLDAPRIQHRPWVWDLLALAGLVALAWALCGFLLRADLYVYGDHPGQFMRFWYPARVSHRLLGWNPLWYAGYPELQFYLPGYVLLGWALDALTLGLLSPFAVYQLLVFGAALLPGLSVYALVRALTRSRGSAFVAGALALIFPELWGGLGALFVGMMGERLAFGMAPLVMLAGWQALHAPQPARHWLLAALALAATALMHPFHAVAPVLFLALCAIRQGWDGARRHGAALALTSLLALGLLAGWLVPLLAHADYAAPMLRATLDETRRWLTGPTVLLYLAAAALTPLGLLAHRNRARNTFALALAGTAALLVAFIFFDHLVLIRKLGAYHLDPVRFSGQVFLALVILAGLGLSGLPRWAARVAGPRRAWLGWMAGLLLAGVGVGVLLRPTLAAVAPQRNDQYFLSQARSLYPLDASWEALAEGEGRILFTSFYLHLDGMPTSLKSMAPYFAGRTIIGGTYSHWGPVARYLWQGSVDVSLLPGQVELIDDASLAGRAWPDWTDGDFLELCQRLAVTTVVTTWDDFQARTFLDAAPHFHSAYSNELFVVYDVLEAEPSLAVSGAASVAVSAQGPASLDLRVEDAAAGAPLLVKVTDYPLWRVRAGGTSLPHQANELGLMALRLPQGSYELQIRYQPGRAERLGGLISLAAAALWLAGLALTFHTPKPT